MKGNEKRNAPGHTHENLARRHDVQLGSDRAFGVVIATAAAVFAGISFSRGGTWWPWLLGVGALFFAAALISPRALHPLNKLWFRLGLLLHRIVNPIVMGVLFFVAVVPTGLVLRARGKDVLRLELDPHARTYWIERKPPGPSPESMKDQF